MLGAGLHDLAAPYALDALDERERRAFRRHLDSCSGCRDALRRLEDAAAALALAAGPATPPPRLRANVLAEARRARPPLPLRRRRPLLAVAAAAAACAAVTLGIWGLRTEHTDGARLALTGASGSLVVAPSGRAVLVVERLAPAPPGHTYQAWIVRDGAARPAGLLAGGKRTVVELTRPLQPGASVAVTLERRGAAERRRGPSVLRSGPWRGDGV
jgi:anti-sigma-K factor RskA